MKSVYGLILLSTILSSSLLILLGALVVPGQNEHFKLQMFEISTYISANLFILSPPIFIIVTQREIKVNKNFFMQS